MKTSLLARALALASLFTPTLAAAQVADRAAAPSGIAPIQSPCVVQADNTCAAVKASVPMPTQETDGTPITSSTLTGNGTLATFEFAGYRGLSFTINGPSGQGNVNAQCSNDQSNWTACALFDVNANSYTTSTATTGRVFYVPGLARYGRLVLSGYASGTWSITGFLRQLNLDPAATTISGVASVQGNVPAGTTDIGNPTKIGGKASDGAPSAVTAGQRTDGWFTRFGALVVGIGDVTTGNYAALVTSANDTKGPGPYAVNVDANNRVWDRTANTWERMVIANDAVGTLGTGLLGVGNLGWDGAAWQRQRLTAGGGLLVADQDGVAVPFTPGGAINAILFSTPTTGYAGVSYQANGSWSGTVSIEGSNDASADCQTGGTWFGLTSMNLNGGNPSTTINGNTGLFIPAATTCARARVSGYNSGSFTGVAVLRSITPLPSTTQVNNYKAQFNSEVNNGTVAASAAKINYTTRDLGGGTVNYSRFSCYFDPGAASAGALGHIEGSPDNSNWTPLLPPVDLSTVTPVTRESRVFYRYNRCAFTNGSAAQTGLYVASQYGD